MSVVTEAPPVERHGGAPAGERRWWLEIFAVSLAGILLEVAYTRIISFKLFYYYTYLIIGLALLGIGSGGVIVALSERVRRAPTSLVLRVSMLAAAAAIGVGYLVIAAVPLDSFALWRYGTLASLTNLGWLLLICVTLCLPFIGIGVVIATLFGRAPERIGSLYFADLLGAGLACLVIVYLILWFGPVFAVFCSALILALVALRLAVLDTGVGRPVAGVLSAVLLAGTVGHAALPDPRVEEAKQVPRRADVSRWSPIFRVDVENIGDDVRLLYHDGLPGSAIYRWDGTRADLARFRFERDARSLPFALLGRPPGSTLVIGAAGGHEILASLYHGARRIVAVELNPVTHDLVTRRYADWDGRIAERPDVRYLNGDGRTYLARSRSRYTLVWYPAPDSYAAMNASTAGAFVLSESYLYTAEAIRESLERLSPQGVVVTQFGEVDFERKPNRTSRYVATARRALADLGVRDPRRHLLVATTPTRFGSSALATIVVSRDPLSPGAVQRFVDQVGRLPGGRLVYAPGVAVEATKPARIVTAPTDRLAAIYREDGFDVGPITDDGPFFWHFRPFREVLGGYLGSLRTADREDTVGERVLVLLLGVAALLAAVLLLLPFVTIRRTWAEMPAKGLSAVYFLGLGLGFMLYEVTLIQRLTLFLGYPTYSLTVTLASLLIFLGLGALWSERLVHRARRLLGPLAAAIVVLGAFYLWGLPPLTDALLDRGLPVRVVTAFVAIAPLGLCLGLFMPFGLGAVAALSPRHAREYVAWGWAVNGFASVIGSVLTTILAMNFGFSTVLVVAVMVYGVAIVALRALFDLLPAARPA